MGIDESFEKLMKLRGAKELQEVMKHWKKLSDNIEKIRDKKLIILPDMLWISNNSVNKTEILSRMSRYLVDLNNLMDFSSSVRYFEFYLVYDNNGQDFPELRRFIYEINRIKGFKNNFEGVVYIDITEWTDHLYDSRFAAFLEYLATNSASWLIVLNVTDPDEETEKKVEKELSAYLRIEKVKFDLPNTDDYLDEIEATLSGYGFHLDDGARALMAESLEKICKSGRLNMAQTVKHLCADIVYRSLGAKKRAALVLSAKDLRYFASDGAYVNKLIENHEKREKNKIGFVGGF